MKAVWPPDNKFERCCYELMRGAYVKARYSRPYRITPDELAWCLDRVGVLRGLVLVACQRRIDLLSNDGE
jgi:hypothetical protein